jgi:hypothetical protein
MIKGQFSCLFHPIFPTWKESENQGNIWKTNKKVSYLNSKIFIQNHFGVRKCFCTLLVFVLRKPKHIIMLDYPKLNACPCHSTLDMDEIAQNCARYLRQINYRFTCCIMWFLILKRLRL